MWFEKRLNGRICKMAELAIERESQRYTVKTPQIFNIDEIVKSHCIAWIPACAGMT
jgi:hypothetical protein